MSLKNKIFGFSAAAVLSLSMVTGAMAATDGATGKADLDPYGGGVCSVSFGDSSFDFGTWEWSGTEYVGEVDDDQSATATVIAKDAVSTCDMTVKFSGLDDGNEHFIPADHFSVKAGTGTTAPPMPTNWEQLPAAGLNVSVTAGNGDFSIYMRLDDVPGGIPAGEYTGDLSVTYTEAQ